jgi:hypothetical protein
VARRLAPDGAARIVAGGWLPGTLVEQVSRAAVRLLNLEATAGGPPGPASGPVGFSSPSVGEAPTAAPRTGTFGPPPVMPQSPAAGTPGVAALPGARDARPPAPTDPHPPTSAEPAGERFTTPPPGVAPQPLWHESAAEDSTSALVPLLTHEGLLLISGDPLVAYDVKTGKARWSKKEACRPGEPSSSTTARCSWPTAAMTEYSSPST